MAVDSLLKYSKNKKFFEGHSEIIKIAFEKWLSSEHTCKAVISVLQKRHGNNTLQLQKSLAQPETLKLIAQDLALKDPKFYRPLIRKIKKMQ